MSRPLNIFLATDYSVTVMNAERYAFEFAKKTNSSLTILHVYEIPFSFPVKSEEYIKESERLRKFELQKLKQHCETLMHSLNIKLNELKWECLVLEGEIEKEIRIEAERIHPDIIITGTHIDSGFKDLFQVSHTWKIIKKSNTPILSIPQDALLTDIKKIVFATEYREGEIPGIEFLIKLSKQFDAELIVLHITSHSFTKEFEEKFFDLFKEKLKAISNYEKLSFELALSTSVTEGINHYCTTKNADWLVMSHSKTVLLEKILFPTKSITKEMSIQSHIPLLSLPDNYSLETNNNEENLTETTFFKKNKQP